MYTQCPHCQTQFRINSEQLKIAAGKVRCCQCEQVFNALHYLQENLNFSPTSDQATRAESMEVNALEIAAKEIADTDDLALETTPTTDSDLIGAEIDSEFILDTEVPVILEQNDGLESEPDYLTGSESHMSELLDKDTSSLLHSTHEPSSPSSIIRFDFQRTGDNEETATEEQKQAKENSADKETLTKINELSEDLKLPSLSASRQAEPAAFGKLSPSAGYPPDKLFEKEPINYKGIAWGFASLVLICLLAIQLLWLNRDQVIQHPLGLQFLTQICRITSCEVPRRRDTSKITIEHRDLRIHPDKSNALIMQLNMVNRAAFDQPLPNLRLSLFDENEKLINERTFQPLEYLPGYAQRDGLMLSSEAINVSMELMDPGKEVTGFKFDFL